MNLKMNWITLRVRDLDTSIAFYHEILGLPIQRRFESRGKQIAMLGSDSQPKIELIQAPGDEPTVQPKNGVSVGFEVESLEDAMEELRRKGVPIARGPITPNPRLSFFYVLDPDGFEVQLAQHHESIQ